MPLDLRSMTGLPATTLTTRRAVRLVLALCAALLLCGALAGAAQASWNLSISKATVPAGGTGFSFTVTGPSAYSQGAGPLNDGGTASGGLLSGLAEGSSDWVVKESDPGAGYTLTGADCTSSTNGAIDLETVNLAARTVTLRVDGSGTPNVSCTFTNTKSTGTITVTKGGTRTATDTDAGYASPLGGASFEYAAHVSDVSLATWFPLCTDSDNDGSCTGPALANGRYLVRERTTAPAGWRSLQSLAWGGGSSGQSPTRPYVGDVTVAGSGVTVAPSTSYPSTSGSGSGRFINARTNPGFPQACGIDLALVLDRSGSINSEPGEADAYKAAAQSFVNSLAGTPTRLKILSFAASASANQSTFLDLSTPADVTTANNVIAAVYGATGGGTNWDAGLDLASGAGIDAAVVITDGNPTVRDSSDGDAGSSSDVDLLDLTFGIASANKLKTIGKDGVSKGAKVIGVGVGDGVTAANIEAISGPGDAYTSSLEQLQATLKQISNALCGSRIKVRKLVTGVAGQAGIAQAGWELSAGSTTAAVNGAFGYAPADRKTAGSPAELLVLVDKIPAAGAPVTITETAQADFSFASAACSSGSYGGPAVPGTTTNAGAGSITLPDVDRNQDLFCTITNARKAGKLEVRKQLVPASDPGRFDLRIDGAIAGSGGAVGDAGTTGEVSLPSGTHSVGETASTGALAEYRSSVECRAGKGAGAVVASNPNGPAVDVALTADSDVVCVITNTRRTGTVKLIKDIVPVDAQAGDPGRFDLTIDGPGANDAATTAAGDGDWVTATVPTGSVRLAETGSGATSLSDYVTSFACQNTTAGSGDDPLVGEGTAIEALSVTDGDAWVCTLSNVRRKGTVTLVKDVVPVDAQLGDPGRFDLHIDGPGGYDATTDEAADGDSVTREVPTGAVSLSESADDETSLADYRSSFTCTNLAQGSGDAPVTGSGTAISDLGVAEGDSWRCVQRNERKQGGVRVTKVIVAVDTQLGDPGRFDLAIDGEGAYDESLQDAANGDSIAINVPNGSVDLSEAGGTGTDLSDYSSAWTCENEAPGSDDAPVSGTGTTITGLDVTDGDAWHCTFTNTRRSGEVKLVKDVVPVDAQAGDDGVFDLEIDGEGAYDALKENAGDGDSVTLRVPNGSVDLRESAGIATDLDDYSSSYRCTAAGRDDVTGEGTAISGLQVAGGDAWVCTFTNVRKQASVKLVKDVVPVDEALGDPGRFDLTIDGEGDYDAAKDEAADGDSVELNVPNGSVDLEETADGETSLGDYSSSYRCTADGRDDVTGDGTAIADLVVEPGEGWTCVLRNERKRGHVKLVKDIVPLDEELGDAGRFNLSIDGENGYDASKTDAGDGDSVELTVPAGTVSLAETAGTGTSLDAYSSSYRCTAEGQDDVSGTGTAITDLPVGDGVSWTCTLTNVRKQSSVKLTKVIVAVDAQLGDGGRFDLHIDGLGGHDTTREDAGDGDSVAIDVPSGAVSFDEQAGTATNLADYTSAYRCVNTAPGSEDEPVSGSGTTIQGLVVSQGDAWHCTFTNTRKHGSVTLVKDLVPVSEALGDPGRFDLRIDGPGGYDALTDEAGDGDAVTRLVPTGTVDLSETADGETTLSDYSSTYACTNLAQGSEDAPVSGDGTQISDLPVTEGDDWRCVLRNVRRHGKVTVIKQLDPSTDDGRFDLSVNGPLGYDVTGADRGHDGSVSIDIPTGTAAVRETAGTATALGAYISGYVCSNEAPGSEDDDVKGSGTALDSLAVAAGDDWVCTFTNVRKPRVTVKKVTEPAGDADTSFAFSSGLPQTAAGEGTQAIGAGGAFSLRDGQQVSTLVTPGTFSVTEADGYAQGYRLKSASCEQTSGDERGPQLQAGGQSEADRTRSFTAEPGDVITCTFVNEKLVGLQVVAKTPKAQSAYIDQDVSYTYEVTNTGTSDLTDVTVADDKCPGPAVRKADKTGDGDATLEPGETWVYSCTVAASAIFTGDLAQVTNTVTVNAKDQTGKPVAPSKDTAVTNLLKPGIAIDKTGPATATAGELLSYTLKVTNTGNTAFSDGMVVLTDALCQAPPALLSKNGDTSPETLSPGESWTYSCQVQTQAGQTKVDNAGDVTGTDQGGRKVSASDTASTALSQPAAQALPVAAQTRVPGSAKLRGTVGCATAQYARAAISGKQIKSVTFSVNGKVLRTLTRPTRGSTYSMRVAVRSLGYGTHKVTARVVFVAAARTKAKTLTLQFSRCRPRVVQPKFTG